MNNMKYNLITMVVFLICAIVEFITRDGGGFTLTGLTFYGIFHLLREGMYILKSADDAERKRIDR